ncbi:hypothetical protein [Xanthomonas campestris]|uniref:hypothetical protein n=1 Tax=Xanthomonas campestris TaxID=339 RepID=UPI001CD76B46|nr:hypothetical protein JH280_10895 [Xanthomonas campestris]
MHPELQRQGAGATLLGRLDAMPLETNGRRVVLDTSQHSHTCHPLHRFVLQQVTHDCYGVGLDRWDMALKRPAGRA